MHVSVCNPPSDLSAKGWRTNVCARFGVAPERVTVSVINTTAYDESRIEFQFFPDHVTEEIVRNWLKIGAGSCEFDVVTVDYPEGSVGAGSFGFGGGSVVWESALDAHDHPYGGPIVGGPPVFPGVPPFGRMEPVPDLQLEALQRIEKLVSETIAKFGEKGLL